MAPIPPEPPTIPASLARALADKYRLRQELGRGGMATVYLADDLKHGRQVAIKLMLPELAAAIGQDRFLREIEVAARLNHPHIVPLFDSGAADGQLYYVMPYIQGESLRRRLDRDGQLPLDEALRLAREIASALGNAHQHGLVHRDVKPENVLLVDGIAMVADFGVARALGGDLAETATTRIVTAPGIAVGTPLYMAPEQAMAHASVDGRADIYALGCTLYEMLAGQPPFTAPSPRAVIARHCNDPVPPLSSLRPGVAEGIVRVIEKALAKSPADRYPTMARFAEALAAADTWELKSTVAAGPALGTIPNNLPRQRTHFIGRERELAECARLLGETRLLTLTGIGGCGKTRLALELAGQLLESYPDGVWFVDLAPVLEPERLPLTVAKAVNAQETPGTPLSESITRKLATQQALVVLDNCEHLMGVVSELADQLLTRTESLKLLVTSREGLGIEGERLIAVRSLSVPARGEAEDMRAIAAAESVQLFVDRARGVEPSFELDAQRTPMVAEICRRLDGIPLAIELAAARVKVLSVAEIRSRLDDRFRLLTGGSRTALPRHQTLRSTIEWSYDHLTEEEQQLLRWLSVFAGGWTLAAATAISGPDTDEFEVLEVIGRLVDKSLVIVNRILDSPTRYSMLETVRQYAREKLHDAGEGRMARSRHLEYFLTLAEELPENERGPRRNEWVARIQREQENMLAALEWCDEVEGGGERGLRIVGPALMPWVAEGHYHLGARIARETLARPGAEPKTAARARVLLAAGIIAYRQARIADAKECLDEALAIYRDAHDRHGMARVLNWSGHIVFALGDHAGARRIKDENLVLCREIGDPLMISAAAMALGEDDRYHGRLDSAAVLYEEAVAISQRESSIRTMAVGLSNLSAIDIARGHLDTARERLAKVGEILDSAGLGSEAAQFLIDLTGVLAHASGDPATGARLVGAAQALLESIGAEREPVDEQFIHPWVDQMRESLGDAAFEAAFNAGRSVPHKFALPEACAWLERNRPPGRDRP